MTHLVIHPPHQIPLTTFQTTYPHPSPNSMTFTFQEQNGMLAGLELKVIIFVTQSNVYFTGWGRHI